MAKKVKIKDREVELEDDVAELLADETGVPFRNRAAEWRRKLEKAEKAAEAAAQEAAEAREAAEAAAKKPAAQAYNPAVYAGSQGAITTSNGYVWNAQANQWVYVGGGQTAAQQTLGLSADDARALAKEELQALKEQEEYETEVQRLNSEWATYDDEREKVCDYLHTKGYTDEQIAEFGPRDLRLVKDAYSNATKQRPARSPQAVVLDTGGGTGSEADISRGGFWDDPAKVRAMSPEQIRQAAAEAKLRPNFGDED